MMWFNEETGYGGERQSGGDGFGYVTLAKAIVEGKIVAARAALDAGADPKAFWIDGRTALRDLAKKRGSKAVLTAMEKLFAPEALRLLPPMREDRSLWSESFVKYVAMRGYMLSGPTTPLSGGGTRIDGLWTAKAGVRMIENKWRRLDDAECRDSYYGKSSLWRLRFGADWNRDRRIVGFMVEFTDDALGWELMEMFKEAMVSGWPDPSDPLVWARKDWEGELMVHDLHHGYEVDDLVKFLRTGGYPFTELGPKRIPLGHEYRAGPGAKPFLDALQEAIGSREGWHLRIAPMLTNACMCALREKAVMKLSTLKAKSAKKSLKERTDIM